MICTIQINNDARDIKRKLDVLRKKCAELKELGVAVAVAYSSSKTNGLFLFEDSRITDVIEAHKEEILLNQTGVNQKLVLSVVAAVVLEHHMQ